MTAYTSRDIMQMEKVASLELVQKLAKEVEATRRAKTAATKQMHKSWSEADMEAQRAAAEAHICTKQALDYVTAAYRAKTA
jgi:hypothetical protein